ncbi:hypothetical protein M9458_039648, partial [Cirrhinus mrigala]
LWAVASEQNPPWIWELPSLMSATLVHHFWPAIVDITQESSAVMASTPVFPAVMNSAPKATKAVSSCSILLSSNGGPAAGIPVASMLSSPFASALSSPVVLSAALSVMAVALLCVWAAHSTPAPPEVMPSTTELSASSVVTKVAVPEKPACPVTVKEDIPELFACLVMAMEAVSELSAYHIMTMGVVSEPFACPISAKEAVLELFAYLVTATEVIDNLSMLSVAVLMCQASVLLRWSLTQPDP